MRRKRIVPKQICTLLRTGPQGWSGGELVWVQAAEPDLLPAAGLAGRQAVQVAV